MSVGVLEQLPVVKAHRLVFFDDRSLSPDFGRVIPPASAGWVFGFGRASGQHSVKRVDIRGPVAQLVRAHA